MQLNILSAAIGTRLKIARIESKLTQAQVGQLMHCSCRVISRIEAGDREPSASEIFILSQLYKKPVTFFYQFSEE